ncbi:MAG: CPXCG motif-containing cysteine-rich protein [Pseudomonadota bacterium]|nr:CPXCG motif-containing cysteine-rich protein [Pseudomonadota bacterium]
MSALIEDLVVSCPYCGQAMEIDIDCTGGDQSFYEDCQTCCMSVRFVITVDEAGNLSSATALRDDE